MKYTLDVAYARSNLVTVQQMLERTTSPITRISLEHRARAWETELEAAERRAALLAQATLLFGGDPVRASEGIEAAFGGTGVAAFQDLVATVTAAVRDGGVGNRGPLPEVPRLLITDVASGSFGFELAEAPAQEPLASETTLKRALDEATKLISAAAESDEVLAEAVSTKGDRVLGKLRSFLQVVHDAGATLKVDTGRSRVRLDTPEIVASALERAAATTVNETVETVQGVLTGLMQERAQFEVRLDNLDVRAGSIDPALDPAKLAPLYNQRVEAKLRRVTAARGTQKRTVWVLVEIAAEVKTPPTEDDELPWFDTGR